jgi:hypothetical protein
MMPPVRIHGCWWHVEVVEGLTDETGKPVSGLCDAETMTIRINKSDPQYMRITLFHEVVHASLPSLSERTVRMIERELFAALSDNGHLRFYLFADE